MAVNPEYLEFLSDFVNGLNIHDQLPVPVSGYNIDDDELVGDFVHWLLQYLNQKHCPLGLVAPLVRSVVEDMLAFCRNDPEAHSLRDTSGQFSQLRLMQACTARANALCVRLHQDPALLASPFLSPPPPHLVPVAAHGARSSQRRGMEDRHVVVHDFNAVFNVQDDTPASYYAVFDGHAGQDAAIFSAAHVHQFLAESPYYPADPVNALKDAILRTDNLYLKKVKFESRYQSGTTALCALLRGRMLHVAWVGDSQAVLVRNGRAEMLVDPHKPKRPDEERRITELGGLVLFHGMWRVNGQLAVSRAIGDPNFKPYVSADAEVRSVSLQGDEELLILASDGLLDFVTPQQAAAAAFQQLQDNPENINAVCSRLINLAKKQGSTDDISVIVAFLTEPRELAKRPVPPVMDMDDLVDTSATHVNGTNNQWANPFHMHHDEQEDAAAAAKKALNMDMALNLDPLQQQPTKQNGSGFHHHQDLFDMGPETDVDRIDESDDDETGSQDGAGRTSNPFGMGGAVEEDEEAELRRFQQQQPEFDAARHPREETPTPPADQVPASTENVSSGFVADVDNVADSGDESEEEWKYFSVEPSKQAPQAFDQLLPSHQQEPSVLSSQENLQQAEPEASNNELNEPESEQCFLPEQGLPPVAPSQLLLPGTEIGEDNNMDSQLNPNAAEFVPVSPTHETCLLPNAEDSMRSPVQLPIDNLGFDMDAVAPTENVSVFSHGDFEDHPMDILLQEETTAKKENLVLQPDVAEFVPSKFSGTHNLDAFEETNTNTLDFCGTPPIAICEPCAPFTTETVEQDSHLEGNQSFEQELQQTETFDMFSGDVLHPDPTIEPVGASEVNTELEPMVIPDPVTSPFKTDVEPALSPQPEVHSPKPEPEVSLSPEPMPEPQIESEVQSEPVAELQTESIAETEPIAELHTELIAEYQTEPMGELQTESVEELQREFMDEPQREFMDEAQREFMDDLQTERISELQRDTMAEPINETKVEPQTESMAGLHTEPMAELHTEPVAELQGESLDEPQPVAEFHNMPVDQYTSYPESTMEPSAPEQPQQELDFFMENTHSEILVQTPSFSVVQGPSFPVIENIVTPDEESAATASPAVEDAPLNTELIPPASEIQEEIATSPLISPTPMSPQLAVCPPAFPSEVEPQVPSSPLEEMHIAPPTDIIMQHEVSSPTPPVHDDAPLLVSPQEPEPLAHIEEHTEEAVLDVTATPPPTPAAPLEDMMLNDKTEDIPSQENIEAFTQVIEKLAGQPEVETSPTTEQTPEHHIEEVLAVAAITATAVGATAALAASKVSKPSSPIKTEASPTKKPASPTKDKPLSASKDKPSSPIKKTAASPASKATPKTSPAKAPVAGKTTVTSTAKSAATKAASPATKAAPPVKTAPAVRKSLTSSAPAATAKPKPAASTTAPKTVKTATSGASSPTKPTAPKPKPPVTAPSKVSEAAKKPLTNGDATKPAPRRPVSATNTTSTAATRTAPKPASSLSKQPGTAATKPAVTSAVTKSPAKPRPASAAVNGVAKPKSDLTTKSSPRPASATSATAATTAKRSQTAAKPATAAKQEKEATNKQLSATTRTITTKTTTTTVTKSTTKSAPAKVPPIKKPTAASAAKTKSPSKASEVSKLNEPAQVNGNAEISNGKEDLLGDVPQQEVLIESSAPCLVPVDGAAD